MTDVDFAALGIDQATFKENYGPWALVAGASHGLGAVFARQLASLGLNCVLLSRRPAVLEELKNELEFLASFLDNLPRIFLKSIQEKGHIAAKSLLPNHPIQFRY